MGTGESLRRHAGRMKPILRLPRYRWGAPVYDVASMERWIYRPGRRQAIKGLRLTPGMRVLDVGCGTGLNLQYVLPAVGAAGEVVGVDTSEPMLRQARRRIRRHGWSNVTLVKGDAARLEALVTGQFDAVLFTYSLSVIGDWRHAWQQAWALLRAGGRIAVVDTSLPAGRWRLLAPVVMLASFSGGVHVSREVWQQVLTEAEQTTHQILTGGHVHLATGTKPLTAHSPLHP